MAASSPAPASGIPVTIVCGFLGAGKTSFLNHVLTADHGRRIAVLVNDFGAVNIDVELIANEGEQVVSLANGCICCSLEAGVLLSALRLIRRDPPPEYILIEASGVADPAQVARHFEDPEVRPYTPLDGIVTIVDSELGPDLEDQMQMLAQRQVAAADVVVLNKTDLADDAQRQRAREWVESLAPHARAVEGTEGRVPVEMVLGIGGGDVYSAVDHPVPGHGHSEPPFDTYTFVSEEPLSMRRLHDTLRDMPKTIFRAKGIMDLAEKPGYPVILQSTGKRATLTVGNAWGDRKPDTRIVFIGSRGGVDGDWLQSRLAAPSEKAGPGPSQ